MSNYVKAILGLIAGFVLYIVGAWGSFVVSLDFIGHDYWQSDKILYMSPLSMIILDLFMALLIPVAAVLYFKRSQKMFSLGLGIGTCVAILFALYMAFIIFSINSEDEDPPVPDTFIKMPIVN
jgi:hypothetical protein